MQTKLTKYLGASFVCFCAAAIAGCADSGQGGSAEVESETVIAPAPIVNPSEPGVAPEPGTIPSVSTNYVYETPARPAPVEPSAGGQQQAPPNPNEQGAQQLPEPPSGDDANPDSINPR